MKKLLTKLAMAVTLVICASFSLKTNASVIYYDGEGSDVCAYIFDGDKKSTGIWGDNNCIPCTHIKDNLWGIDVANATGVIFMSGATSADDKKLTQNCTVTDGYVYKKSNVDQPGSKFMCFNGYSIDGVTGDWNGSNYPLATTSDVKKMTFDFSVSSNQGYFKFYNANTSKVCGAKNGNQSVTANATYYYQADKGHQFDIATGNYTVTIDLSEESFIVTKSPTASSIWISGHFNGSKWTKNDAIEIKLTDGVGEYTVPAHSGDNYIAFWTENGTRLGRGSNISNPTALNTSYTAYASEDAIQLPGSDSYKILITSYEKDNSVTFKISAVGDNPNPGPNPGTDKIYINGLYNGHNWNRSNNDLIQNGTYELESTDKIYFSFFFDQTIANNFTNQLGPGVQSNNAPATLNTTNIAKPKNGEFENAFTLPAGKYTISNIVKSGNNVSFSVTKTGEAVESGVDYYLWGSFSELSDKGEFKTVIKFEEKDGKLIAIFDTGNDEYIHGFHEFRIVEIDKKDKYDPIHSQSILNNERWYAGSGNIGNNSMPKTFNLIRQNNVMGIESGSQGIFTFELTLNGEGHPQTLNVSRSQRLEKEYYLVGDMNDWFSYEFENPVYDGDNLRNTGMSHSKMQAEKNAWKFTKTDDGWYELKLPLLSGQFQIFDGSSRMWEGEVYAHSQNVPQDGNNKNQPWEYNYLNYYGKPITRAEIKNQIELRSYEYYNDKVGINVAPRITRKILGETNRCQANLHMECNAVKDAVIRFKPNENNSNESKPAIMIAGTPIDYYIFYAMESDGHQNVNAADEIVTSKILSEKPNVNNYFLPGIEYATELKNTDNKPHMNLTGGINLISVKKTDKETGWQLSDFKDGQGKDIFSGLDTELIKGLQSSLLPNGYDISGYDQLWIQKIPSGFEYPAGRKYVMHFLEARGADEIDKEGKTKTHSVTTDHMYFFPVRNVHVHFNKDAMANSLGAYGNTLQISYRVYYQKGYDTYVVEHCEDGSIKEHLVSSSGGSETEPTYGSEFEYTGWLDMEHYHSKQLWDTSKQPMVKPFTEHDSWHVACNEECGGVTTQSVNSESDFADDKRIAEDGNKYSQAYVQFKIEFDYPESDSADGQGTHKVYYMPTATSVRDTEHHSKFGGFDLYVAPKYNLKDIVTGISKIPTDEEYFEGVNAEPVYYNLQGVRVQNPTKGIYIKVTGSKSEKVIF